MAAGQPPDPRTFDTWEDAFQYPVPVVRKLEQQLRKNIDENKQKLRSLVGASYRDLLGTAEKIIEMDEQMQTAESHMVDIGRRCNARTLERVAENHVRMRKRRDLRELDKYRAVAQTKVLQNALNVTARLIKRGGDALQATKLLVLGRLLHKSVSEGPDPPAVLDELRARLDILRRKLLSYIDRALTASSREQGGMTTALCAYALLTSSSPREVLRHFLQLRLGQLQAVPSPATTDELLAMLDSFSTTLSDCRDLFPRRFADALSLFSKAPLVQDSQVLSTFQLNLDVYSSWVADDVRTFIPWVRHDHLTTSEVADALRSWTQQAQECILGGLKKSLSIQDNAHELLSTRHQVLSKYLATGARIKDDNHVGAIDGVRKAFLERFHDLIANAAACPDLGLSTTTNVSRESQSRSLWGLGSGDLDLSSGTGSFRKSILDIHQGRDDSLRHQIELLDGWMAKLTDSREVTQKMRSEKWAEDFDFDVDDLSEKPLLVVFSKRDPESLLERLRISSTSALNELYRSIEQASKSPGRASFLIRLLREVDQRRRSLKEVFDLSESSSLSPEVLRSLHQEIAEHVATKAIDTLIPRHKKQARRAIPLWDGVPPLPVQPSPATFRFLVELSRAMSEAGNDLWGPASVEALKSVLAERLPARLNAPDDDHEHDEPLTKGHAEKGNTEEERQVNGERRASHPEKDDLSQDLFDALYLQRILTTSKQAPDSALQTRINTLNQQLDLADASYERMRRSANDYWKRTYLLFGLLASGV